MMLLSRRLSFYESEMHLILDILDDDYSIHLSSSKGENEIIDTVGDIRSFTVEMAVDRFNRVFELLQNEYDKEMERMNGVN